MAQSIGSVIREWLKANGLEEKVQEGSIPAYWEEIVGEAIARNARLERIDKGRIFISVDSATWRAEVTMRREEIRQRINERLGAEVIQEIIVR